MKVGIIGLGAIASQHIKAINALRELRLHSGCRRNKKELNGFCKKYGTKGFTDYKELLKDGVDIVVVALPHALHYKVGMEALDYGCHLVMEKPFAVTMEQCRNLCRKAKEKDLKIVTTDSIYHLPKIKKAREIAKSGKLGRFISGSIINYKDYYFNPQRPKWFLQPEMAGGGELINVGVHRVAYIRSIIGSEEKTVKASVGFFEPGYKVEGNGLIFIGYRDGSAAIIEEIGYYKLHPNLDKCFHFNFEKGVINLSRELNIVYKDGSIEYPKIPQEEVSGYLSHYKQLLTAIKEDRDPYPGAREGMMDVRIILAAYESAKTGKEIRLNTPNWELDID